MTHKILIVEDERPLREMFAEILSDEGFEVSLASDYKDTIEAVTVQDYDLIITDIILGDRTGIDILREIKQRGLKCPVIIVTGAPSVGTASEAVKLGAFDYISKPVSAETLVKAASLALKVRDSDEKYERTRKNLEAIFRSVKDAIIMLDGDQKILEMNRAAAELCGLHDDMRGSRFPACPLFCCRSCTRALEDTIQSGTQSQLNRIECKRQGYPTRIVTVTTVPFAYDDRTSSGAVMVIRDDTRLARLEQELGQRGQYQNIIGESREMRKIFTLIEELADIESTVLITGESGTGKELVAEALHHSGNRGNARLVKVDCSAIPEQLLESELFGHVKGSFTGASADKPGKFELANGGSIFLDEIGDIPLSMQVKLLRVLQDKEFYRVGGIKPIRVDVRIIAATNRNLQALLQRGAFREDLYYRLKVFEIRLPGLRERREDIPHLVRHFLGIFNDKFNKQVASVSGDVTRFLLEYPWPGNVRELAHTLEHATLMTRSEIITMDDLPGEFREKSMTELMKPLCSGGTDEKQNILQALKMSGWNKTKAARLLGVSRQTLYEKLKKYDIEGPLAEH